MVILILSGRLQSRDPIPYILPSRFIDITLTDWTEWFLRNLVLLPPGGDAATWPVAGAPADNQTEVYVKSSEQ